MRPSLRSATALLLFAIPLLGAGARGLAATHAELPAHALPAQALPAQAFDDDWTVDPDPPTADQDLTITYHGADDQVSYEVEGEGSVDVDTSRGSFTIPKAKLAGKSYVKLKASGGEAGFRIVRLR